MTPKPKQKRQKIEKLTCGCKVRRCSCDQMMVWPPKCCEDCPMSSPPATDSMTNLHNDLKQEFNNYCEELLLSRVEADLLWDWITTHFPTVKHEGYINRDRKHWDK